VVRLVREGAADVIGLPADPESVVARSVVHAVRPGESTETHELVGQTEAIQRVREEIVTVAPTLSTVLITGETGSGKGVAAQLVHRLSSRSAQPFVHVDCAALAPTVVESELFGHERGAFTGAVERRAGRFERAGRGTVFLDEIGELSPDLQAKLLRVLQERSFERIGGSAALRMEARVIAATNRDLRAAVRAGRFRRDLYFRLAVYEIHVPPLRERRDDIPLLVRRQLEELSARLAVPVPVLDPSFCRALARHDWPGNVRELCNVLERLIVSARGGILDAASVEAVLRPLDQCEAIVEALPAFLHEQLEGSSEEIRHLARILVATGGNISRASRRLGIPRGTLRYRIERHGLGFLIHRD
jgi:transcriptional regulator with GAF, ATPase, and Fis domain